MNQNNTGNALSLVYLARGKNAGLKPIKQFIKAYKLHNPGCPHKLFVIMKGWDSNLKSDKEVVSDLFQQLGAEIIDMPDNGFDWGAYFRFASNDQSEYICFLNTFSRPLAKDWLAHLYINIKAQNVGMCGATGSLSGWRFKFPITGFWDKDYLLTPFRIVWRLILHIRYAKYFPDNFSPHIRSTGFIVKGEQFRDFISFTNFPKTIFDVYLLESGIQSYSSYILNLGQCLKIVDSLGKSFDIHQWSTSKTYCCPGQPGLIIADNNTDFYKQKTRVQKRKMEYDTWNKVLTK